jgi:hypothetical protein
VLLEQAAMALDEIDYNDKALVDEALLRMNGEKVRRQGRQKARQAFLEQFDFALTKPEVTQKFNMEDVKQTVFKALGKK